MTGHVTQADRTVPLLDLQAQYLPLRDELLAAITRVCDNQRWILGPEVDACERELGTLLGFEHVVAVSSGTDALLVALMALGVGPGDDVVTTTYSFYATAGTVARVGARPVFVDVDPETLNVEAAAIAKAIGPRTKAVIVVHLFGSSADLDPILGVAREAGIPVVEDACQAIGATYKGRPVGGDGIMGAFSFYPSKNLSAFGDAGLVVTRDGALAERLRRLRVHGSGPEYVHKMIGGNFRMDALQAAVLRVKAPHLAAWNGGRRRNAARYDALLVDAGLGDRVRPLGRSPHCDHTFHQYVVRAERRDALRAYLTRRGVGTAVYYPVPFHLQECFADLGHRAGDFPHAERAASESLALPIYPELTTDQQDYVVACIAAFYRSQPSDGPA